MPLSTATAQIAMTAAARQPTRKARMDLASVGCVARREYAPTAVWIKGSRVAMMHRNALGLGGIARRVDVEEGVDRARRPIRDGDTVARGPALDLVQPLTD